MKVITALVKGINQFTRDYNTMPHIALMHPASAKELEKEKADIPKGSAVLSITKDLEIRSDNGVAKDNIIFLMRDKSL